MKLCLVCKKEFEETSNKKYCSKECREKAHHKTHDVYCCYCGKEIKRSNRFKNFFCSKKCALKFRYDNLTENTSCIECGKIFYKKNSNHIFC